MLDIRKLYNNLLEVHLMKGGDAYDMSDFVYLSIFNPLTTKYFQLKHLLVNAN